MSLSPLVSLLLISLLPISLSTTLSADLRRLQSTSPAGVIHINDLLLSRILSISPLRFSILIFFDAKNLHKTHPELNLETLHSEFTLLSNSYLLNQNPERNSSKDLFFCDVELKESQKAFELFEITSLPHIRLVSESVSDVRSESVPMPPSEFESAEKMASFVESRTGMEIGPIRRLPMFTNWQKVVMGCGFGFLIIFMAKKVIAGETLLQDRRFWVFGAVFVYFFSVSGAMFNIIRKMPMFIPDKNDHSKMMYFYQGSGMQLGAEGFAIGGLYTIVGLLLAFVTHGLVRVKNGNVQRLGMLLAMFVSFWAVKQVIFLDNWKTGYGIHMYWPTSWR